VKRTSYEAPRETITRFF